jgi:deferrochelatase/peroxidase EfeB
VARLRSTLAQVAPAPADLPLRAHEILEDAQRDHLTGLTNFGSGAGLAETLANVDATAALLGVLGPLVDARRPGLLAGIHTGLTALRTALLAPDSGVFGPDVPAGRLTVTVSVGASLFNERFGLAGRKPVRLASMPVFPNDALEPGWCHGDIMLQICADDPDTVHYALREITRGTRGALQLRYRLPGLSQPTAPVRHATQLDGVQGRHRQPHGGRRPRPDLGGGSGRARLGHRRHLPGGAPHPDAHRVLGPHHTRRAGGDHRPAPGQRCPAGRDRRVRHPRLRPGPGRRPRPARRAHQANPRTTQSAPNRILRRGYNYDSGLLPNGNLDAGFIFCCYQQDIRRQFETVQSRLAEDPLNDYIRPFGGGYFFALPGVTSPQDWYARALLS